MAIAAQEAVAALVTDPKADVVAQDRGGCSHGEDDPHGQLVSVTCIDRRRDQYGLSGQRNAEALRADQESNCVVTVGS
jgi:hypothetical protein